MLWILLLTLALLIPLALVLFHLRPLSQAEVAELADKRRMGAVGRYFEFQHHPAAVNPSFKSNMASLGKFYSVSEPLAAFPSIAAGLLKYKKHEWVIIALVRNQSVVLMWVNKGKDASEVTFRLSAEEAAEVARTQGCTSVLILHNHPNPNPSRYTASHPSDVDLEGSRQRGDYLTQCGLNLLEFVCERGQHHEYHRSVFAGFMPISGFLADVEALNGRSRRVNLSLHRERLLGAGSSERRAYGGTRPSGCAASLALLFVIIVVTELPFVVPLAILAGYLILAAQREWWPFGVSMELPADSVVEAAAIPERAVGAWYPDPMRRYQHRYWDGVAWTGFVADNGRTSWDALEP